MKWYSTDSLYTAQRSPINAPGEISQMSQVTEMANYATKSSTKNNLVIIHKKNSVKSSLSQKNNQKHNYYRSKAGSIHDLRRCAVSNLLKVPPQYTTFESTQRMPLHVHHQQIKTKVNHNHNNPDDSDNRKINITTAGSDEVLVIQTDTIKQDLDPDPNDHDLITQWVKKSDEKSSILGPTV